MKRYLRVLSYLFLIALLLGIFTFKARGMEDNSYLPYMNIYKPRSFEGKIALYGRAEKIPVLMYHHLLEAKDKKLKNNLILTVEKFREQMRYLYENDYTTITMRELELFLDNKLELPKKSVLITFDDGYKSNYLYAYKILKSYNFKASIALIPKFMPAVTEKFNPARLNCLSWEEVLAGRDVFEYVNHTFSHTSMKEISSKAALKEISEAAKFIKSAYFVYPIGHTSPASEAVLKKLNYKLAFTTKAGFVRKTSSRLYLPRQRVSADISLKVFSNLLQ